MTPFLLPALLLLGPQSQDLNPKALQAALEDERHTEAFYQAVMDRHGAVRPFVHVIEAERRHQSALLAHFERLGIPVPANPWVSQKIAVPSTLDECYRKAAQAEVENVALYDHWLKVIQDPSLRETFERLRWASQERHLPAFRRHFEP